MIKVAAFTCICEEDARFIPQYLREVERLQIPFAIHFDRCCTNTKMKLMHHPLCIDCCSQEMPNIEYTEQHKQDVFDLLCNRDYDWALHWDMDEVWEDDVLSKLDSIERQTESHLRVTWVNCWEAHDRVRYDDLMHPSPRVKLYRIGGGRVWKFDHPIIYGCKLIDKWGDIIGVEGNTDIACIHTGLMTDELRCIHAERWDRIYGKAVGKNPYKLWHALMDFEKHPVKIVDNLWRRLPI